MKQDEFLKNQQKMKIGSLDVYFPFLPYDCQKDYMSKVISALQRGENALLESPTGTGKTLALLCSALSWLQAERLKLVGKPNEELPRLIYCSRTHSQLS